MIAMEVPLESISPVSAHPQFHDSLTSILTPVLPEAVLQNTVKMINESPPCLCLLSIL
jgi:hypothetical protein